MVGYGSDLNVSMIISVKKFFIEKSQKKFFFSAAVGFSVHHKIFRLPLNSDYGGEKLGHGW